MDRLCCAKIARGRQPPVTDLMLPRLSDALQARLVETTQIGDDLRLTLRPQRSLMSQTKSKPNIWARRKARRALVQAAYQWQFANSDLAQLQTEFAERALDKADDEFFADILARMINHSDELDAMLAPLLDRPIEQLDLVERGVLRLAAVELSERIDVPYRVVIDEYVELTKLFGSEDAHKFVNGVLDKLSAQQRHLEVNAHREHRRE